MPPGLLALVSLLNDFSDGMIHGVRCRVAFDSCTLGKVFIRLYSILPVLGVAIVGAGCVSPLLTSNFISTRRFCARPLREVFSATGCDSPNPYGVTMRRSGML